MRRARFASMKAGAGSVRYRWGWAAFMGDSRCLRKEVGRMAGLRNDGGKKF